MKTAPVTTLVATTLVLFPAAAHGQVRGSERSRVSQTSDATTVTIDYARPHARGRTPVFGGLVPWGHVWTPGANEATTFEASNDVRLNGVDVPQGRYSVWMIPSEGEWDVVLDPTALLYHTQPPAERDGQIRLSVEPTTTAFTEALTWEFPLVDPSGMALHFRWGTKAIPLRIDVEPTAVTTVTAEEAAPLVGDYDVGMAGPPPPGMPEGAMPPPMMMEVRYEGDQVVGTIHGGPPGLPNVFALLPVADNVFNPAWMMDGAIFETEVDMYFEFNVEGRQAVGFDVRGLEDRLMMRGTRR